MYYVLDYVYIVLQNIMYYVIFCSTMYLLFLINLVTKPLLHCFQKLKGRYVVFKK